MTHDFESINSFFIFDPTFFYLINFAALNTGNMMVVMISMGGSAKSIMFFSVKLLNPS
jgi:hypothetical protein